jgi:Uma2 family endonuclease
MVGIEYGKPGFPMSHAQTHEPDAAMTRQEYLAWVEQQPTGRFERIDGIVVAMAPERASHNLCKGSARDALRRAVRDAGLTSCQVFTDGMSIRVDNSDFEPDALLRCGPRLPGDATHAPDPMILVEVLSPDSGTRDRATKLRAYFKLPSVQHYLIVWPDEPRIVRHSRGTDNDIATEVFLAGPIPLTPPGITVTVEAFYTD